MRIFIFFFFSLLITTFLAQAKSLQGFYFQDQDWEVACDNTGTCRAAGYAEEQASILLTRLAGLNTQASAAVAFSQKHSNERPIINISLLINNSSLGTLISDPTNTFFLTTEQTQHLLNALKNNDKIEIATDKNTIQIPINGSHAILEKIDQFQKRVGTSSAFLNPVTGHNGHVLIAEPKPEIITQPVDTSNNIRMLSEFELHKMIPSLALTPEMNCQEFEPDRERYFYVIEIDKNYSLIRTECFDISRVALWLIDNAFSRPPQLITHDGNYEEGKIWYLSGAIRSWVWDGNNFVLSDEYYDNSGLGHRMSIGGMWYLPTYVSNVSPRKEKDTIYQVQDALTNAIIKEKTVNPELKSFNLAKQFPIKREIVVFTVNYDKDNQLEKEKPDINISDDEWSAFLNTTIYVDSEFDNIHYSLIDLDNDGKRDLIINSYVGGTGLFSRTYVLKQGDKYFYPTQEEQSGDWQELFSVSGRGANQWGEWIEINDEIYCIWFDGHFGNDKFYIMRPFGNENVTPIITVDYHYHFNQIEIEQQRDTQKKNTELSIMSDKEQQDLFKLLDLIQTSRFLDTTSDGVISPICPIPEGISDQDKANYSMVTPPHYFVEYIDTIPVWLNGKCYLGTVVGGFGQYNNNISVQISIKSPEDINRLYDDYYVIGKREVISIKNDYML